MAGIAALAAALLTPPAALGVGLPSGFQASPVITGLVNPTAVRFAPNGQVFVAEKSGLLLVYDGLGDTTPTTVVDLRTQVHNFWDRGLLGLAVDPDFPVRPYLYTSYTHDALPGGTAPQWGSPGATSDPCPTPPGSTADGCVVQGRLSRIDVNPITMQGTEAVLLQNNWCQQYPSHSVGDLAFGPDGMLYASGGDGASFTFTDWGQDGSPVNPCGDPGGSNPTPPTSEGGALRSQDVLTTSDPTSFDGTVLRIDVSNVGAGAQVPGDNPLVGKGRLDDDLVIAHGLRNPFRFTIRPGTPELWITEVGWNTWEEVNRIADPTDGVVENFGWPCFEGSSGASAPHGGYDAANLAVCEGLYANGVVPFGGGVSSVVTPSVYAYNHGEQVVPGEACGTGSSSATGAAFYQDGDYPVAYTGAFFFADYSRKCIWAMRAGPGGAPDPAQRATFASNAGGVVDLQIGPGGDLFYVDLDAGQVVRLEYFAANEPPNAVVQAAPTSGAAPLLVQLDGSASSDPEDGASLLFAWDLDGDGSFDDSTLVAPSHTFVAAGSHLVRLRVTDSQGASDLASISVVASNVAPVAEILSPSPSLLWAVGDEIAFSGTASDLQDGPLPAANLTWSVILHHCDTPLDCHAHPIQDLPGIASGSLVAPDHEYPSYLELKLTATDFGVGGWWDPAWTRRQKLILDNGDQSEALDGFPLLVVLDPTRIDYALVADGGADLRFVDADGTTELPYEIDTWNEAGVSSVWVRVPRIDGGSSTDHVWMYYGNPSATDAQDGEGVWAGYAGVWHMDPSLQDSTANANHGTNSGTTAAPGWIGSARQFDGVSSGIDAGNGASLRITGQVTLEAWIAIDDPNQSGAPRVFSKKPFWNAGEGYNLEYKPGANNLSSVGSGSDWIRADAINLDTSWHWVGASINGGTGATYVDGVDRTTDSTLTPLVAGNQSLRFGREQTEFFLGRIDEIRIAPMARSADWMAAQYLSMSDAFVTFVGPEDPAVLSATASVEILPAPVTLTFETDPPGLELAVGSDVEVAPFSRTVIVGSTQSVSAPTPQSLGGTAYAFQSWSDGGAQSHNLVAPGVSTTYVASYQSSPECADGIDNDGDGEVDYPADPGCRGALSATESPQCDDGIDNDGDGTIDWDGGPSGGTGDASCAGLGWRSREKLSSCGLGFEVALALPLLLAARRARSRRS